MNSLQMTFLHIRSWCCFLLCLPFVLATGQSFVGREILDVDKKWLSTELLDVQLFALDSRALLNFVKKNPAETTIQLQFGKEISWQIKLTLDPVQSDDYQLTISSAARLSINDIGTYRGKITNGGACYLTLSEGFIYGVFEMDDKTYFIEPARRFNKNWGEDYYLFYETADILPNPAGNCAGAVVEGKSNIFNGLEKSVQSCYTVELAIAADYSMYQIFGSTSLLEKYVLAILNSVRSNYDDEFNFEIRFQAIKLWVSTCATCDPWNATNDYEALLASFRTWGNNGNFGVKYDLATLWTGRTMTDKNGQNIGGGGYYGVLCGSSRYNVLRRYSENAGLMRALQAHEFGHNLNADHDSTNSQTIMAPFIRDVKAWSAMSKVRINSYFANAMNISNCLTACAAPTFPTADFFALQSSGCAPFTVHFYNNSSSNATSWEWVIGGTVVSTETNPMLTFAQPGLYDIRLRAKNAAGVSELVKSAMIEVKGPPESSFSIDYQAGATSAILKTTVASDSVIWHFENGETSQARIVTRNFTMDGDYPATLIAYNECGADTLTQIINIVTIPKAGFTAENVVGCAPLQVQFDNQSSTNVASFAWEFPGGKPTTSTERNPMVRYEQAGVYSVALVVRNAAGSVTARQSNLVQVNRVPKANFSTRVEKNVVSLRNLTESGSTYVWNFGDSNTSVWTNPEHAYTAAGTYTVTLIATNACGRDTFVKIVEILGAPPAAAFIANQRQGCTPLTVTFNDLSQNEPESRRWFFAGGNPETSQQANPTVQYTQPGTYPVRLEVVNTFGKDTLNEQNFVIVTEKPKVAAFNWQIAGFKVTFTLSENTQANQRYEWLFGNGKRSTDPQPIHEYDATGTYSVMLIVTNDCGSDTLQQTIKLITTSTSNGQTHFAIFQLYPNPHAGRFQLQLQGEAQSRLQIRIVNALGQEMHREEADFTSGKWSKTFDLQNLTNGVYWLEINDERGKAAKPFVVRQP